MSGVHVIMNSNEQSVCSIAGSIVRTSEHYGLPVESTIVISKIHRRSPTNSIGPFVGLADPHPQMDSSASANWPDLPISEMEGITIVGTDLSLESQHLMSTTGPLFSFGMSEQELWHGFGW
ncbi:hypothetical protein BLNAU_14364 [Blattamonas nauphoetae]|uniref:Uncharacterized protein n=1 Tax=Blattamonas nauphoetae TaxID=2049346 RepID=A0ABQ9XDZ2_9EUKA|nr:hypothetical protein BLNAU_14364 [Blattamonas nauphoetae]